MASPPNPAAGDLTVAVVPAAVEGDLGEDAPVNPSGVTSASATDGIAPNLRV